MIKESKIRDIISKNLILENYSDKIENSIVNLLKINGKIQMKLKSQLKEYGLSELYNDDITSFRLVVGVDSEDHPTTVVGYTCVNNYSIKNNLPFESPDSLLADTLYRNAKNFLKQNKNVKNENVFDSIDKIVETVSDLIPFGNVDFVQNNNITGGDCNNSAVVLFTQATKGWGPLLYEVALEICSTYYGGLMADRSTVSHKAFTVWRNYLENRPDVEKIQLDINKEESQRYKIDQITPDLKRDDCSLESTFSHLGYRNPDLNLEDEENKSKIVFSNPLSFAYKKKNDKTIKTLKGIQCFYTR
jgi:hypothetical protein